MINEEGAGNAGTLRVYCSEQTHSSIEKAVKISGIGRKNLVKIPVREDFSMDPAKLREAIEADKRKGYHPCCVIATLGTTGTTAIDPLRAIGEICAENGIWLHVDAAMAGTALILPEFNGCSMAGNISTRLYSIRINGCLQVLIVLHIL